MPELFRKEFIWKKFFETRENSKRSLEMLEEYKIYDLTEGRGYLDADSIKIETERLGQIFSGLEHYSGFRNQNLASEFFVFSFDGPNKHIQKHQKFASIVSFLTLVARALFKSDTQAKQVFLKKIIESWFDKDSFFSQEDCREMFEAIEAYLDLGVEIKGKVEDNMNEDFDSFFLEEPDGDGEIDLANLLLKTGI